jgi:hypothetical protein
MIFICHLDTKNFIHRRNFHWERVIPFHIPYVKKPKLRDVPEKCGKSKHRTQFLVIHSASTYTKWEIDKLSNKFSHYSSEYLDVIDDQWPKSLRDPSSLKPQASISCINPSCPLGLLHQPMHLLTLHLSTFAKPLRVRRTIVFTFALKVKGKENQRWFWIQSFFPLIKICREHPLLATQQQATHKLTTLSLAHKEVNQKSHGNLGSCLKREGRGNQYLLNGKKATLIGKEVLFSSF